MPMIMPYSHNVKSAYAYAFMTIDNMKIGAVRHLISFVQWVQQLWWYAISQAICSLLPNEHMHTVTNVDSDFYCATLSDSSGLNNLKANHYFFVLIVTVLFMTSQQQLSGGKNHTTLSVLSVVDSMQA